MPGERRPDPHTQVRAALEDAKRDPQLREDFPQAWALATNGHVCDSYSSARGEGMEVTPSSDGCAPNLRASSGQKRCAGCRFVQGAGSGVARCTLYNVSVYSGVLWPHRTGDRHEWQWAILSAEDEWRAAFEEEPTRYSLIHEMLRRLEEGQPLDLADVTGGSVAA